MDINLSTPAGGCHDNTSTMQCIVCSEEGTHKFDSVANTFWPVPFHLHGGKTLCFWRITLVMILYTPAGNESEMMNHIVCLGQGSNLGPLPNVLKILTYSHSILTLATVCCAHVWPSESWGVCLHCTSDPGPFLHTWYHSILFVI